jgi:hypothetical protein
MDITGKPELFINLHKIFISMKKISSKQEGAISIIAAVIVLFSAMFDPMVSVVLAIAALVVLGVFMFMNKH